MDFRKFLIFLAHFLQITASQNLSDYLENQLKIVQKRLAKYSSSLFEVDFNVLGDRKLGSSNIQVFLLFNFTYVFVDRELHQFSPEEMSLNSTGFIVEDKIQFVKAKNLEDLGIILVATKSGIVHIFEKKSNTSVSKIQSIDSPNISDATFFINQASLYLVISNFQGNNAAPVVFYKFTGTHFDEFYTTFLTAATKVNSFRSGGNEIVIVSQKLPHSSVFLFSFEKIKKIHKIEAEYPKNVLSYIYKNNRYVVVFHKNFISLHLWTGSELVFLQEISSLSSNRVATTLIDQYPFVLTSGYNSSLALYSLMNKRISTAKLMDYPNFSKLLELQQLERTDNKHKLLVATQDPDGNKHLTIISVTISVVTEAQKIEHNKSLSNCFHNLEINLYQIRNKIHILQNTTLRKKREDNNSTENGFEELKEKYVKLRSTLSNLDPSILVVNGSVILKNITADEVFGKEARFKKINGIEWDLDKLLSHPAEIQDQKIKAKVVRVNNLRTKSDLFKDLLLKHGDQIISGPVSVGVLKTDVLKSDSINNISFSKIYLKSQPEVIKGRKTFPSLSTKNMKISEMNEVPGIKLQILLSTPSLLEYRFGDNLKIRNLWVETINKINYETFKNSVFRISDPYIEGSVSFANLTAENGNFTSINSMKSFLTTKNQFINSMKVPKIIAEDINPNFVNNIKFSESVAKAGDLITGPVKMKNVYVKNDLEMSGKVDESFFVTRNEHIVGTNESDLLQMYAGKVKIKGNLTLTNVDLLNSTKIVLSGKDFGGTFDRFWSKTSTQVIPNYFEALNGISTPQLYAHSINNIHVSDFLKTTNKNMQYTKFGFENMVVRGNVILNTDQQHFPNLRKIQDEAVKTNGSFNIRGRKTYNDTLKVYKLEVNNLNNQTLGDSSIQNLIIKGDLIADEIQTLSINGINITALQEQSLYVHTPQNITEMKFENVSVKFLDVRQLNEDAMEKVIVKLNNIDEIDKISKVIVDGDVKLEKVQGLKKINGLEIDSLLHQSAASYKDGIVYGNITFTEPLNIKDLYVINVNAVDLSDLTERLLYKTQPQIITASFKFTRIKSENLVAPKINEFNIENLLDTSSPNLQIIVAPKGLKIEKINTIKNLNLEQCGLNQAVRNIAKPPPQTFDHVIVNGNATFWDKSCNIQNIFNNAVTKRCCQVITGHVSFTNNILADNTIVKGLISGVNFTELANDALLTESPDLDQVITGRKSFSQLRGNNMVFMQNLKVLTINNLDINKIDQAIVTKDFARSSVIYRGKKVFFDGLQTKRFYTRSISNVRPENLVTLTRPEETVADAVFESIEIGNDLNVEFVNNVNFSKFLQERLLLKDSGQSTNATYFFGKILVNGNMTTPSINNISLNNVVFDNNSINNIESPKRFLNEVVIQGDGVIEYLNGLKLSHLYEQAVMNNDSDLQGDMKFMEPSIVEGNITTEFINNFPFNSMVEIIKADSIKTEANRIAKISREIIEFIERNLESATRMPIEYMYLEKSTNLQISIRNTVGAQVVHTRDDILIHVEGEEPGRYCGLPDPCKCPIQLTMQISSEHSVNAFLNKGTQRIYSYFDEGVSMNFITNSISTNAYCRTNQTRIMNEISSLTWTRAPTKNTTGGFYMHNEFFSGFISGVKFFTIHGNTYVLVGKYYEPVRDSHNLQCVILKLDHEKNEVHEIQTIPTEGMWTVSLIYTADGVVIIIGNVGNGRTSERVHTQIYRFNENLDKFEFLRTIPYFGGLSAVGVVLEMDSLIVLANKQSTLHILKYVPEFDNYYFYQSFQLDYPVLSMSVFYAGDFGISDAYLSVVTENDRLYLQYTCCHLSADSPTEVLPPRSIYLHTRFWVEPEEASIHCMTFI